MVVPQNEWFIMENPIKIGWFGGTHIFGNTQMHGDMVCLKSLPHTVAEEEKGLRVSSLAVRRQKNPVKKNGFPKSIPNISHGHDLGIWRSSLTHTTAAARVGGGAASTTASSFRGLFPRAVSIDAEVPCCQWSIDILMTSCTNACQRGTKSRYVLYIFLWILQSADFVLDSSAFDHALRRERTRKRLLSNQVTKQWSQACCQIITDSKHYWETPTRTNTSYFITCQIRWQPWWLAGTSKRSRCHSFLQYVELL